MSRNDDIKTLLSFTPGEGSTIEELLASTQAMEHLPAIPSPIRGGHFKVTIDGDNLQLLREGDFNNSGPVFGWGEVDNMVQAIQEAVKVSLDMKKLRSKHRTPYTYYSTSGEVVEE